MEGVFGFALDKTLLIGLGHGLSRTLDAQPLVDVANFSLHGSLVDEEGNGDLRLPLATSLSISTWRGVKSDLR